MNECQKRGHRVIKMICDECGQEVNRATFKAPDGWVSVKERLPELGIEVLVYYDDRWDVLESIEYEGKIVFFHPEQGYITHATHWQPLPKPPKELPK